MRTLATSTFMILLASAGLVAACDTAEETPQAPGSAVVEWNLGPVADCSGTGIATVRAQALSGDADTDPAASSEAPCESDTAPVSGSIELTDLTPGAYDIVVEGLDSSGNPIYEHVDGTRVTVPEGEAVSTDDLTLEVKRGYLVVDWNVGGKCSTSGVTTVNVSLFEADGTPLEGEHAAPQEAPCDNAFEDVIPNLAGSGAGVAFLKLKPNDGLTVLVEGKDDAGDVVMRGTEAEVSLGAGETKEIVVDLEAVATDG